MVNKGQPGGQPLYQPDGRATDVSTPTSSSSLESLEKLTTKPEGQSPEQWSNQTGKQSGILDEPELRWWKGREKGEGNITERQVENWLAEFDMSHDEMKLSLRHGKFDILQLGNINSPEDWFYSRLSAKGAYICLDYKSLSEIRAESLRDQLARDEKARAEACKIEKELAFNRIMENPDSPEYKNLFGRLSEFAQSEMDPSLLRDAMRSLFFPELIDGSQQTK